MIFNLIIRRVLTPVFICALLMGCSDTTTPEEREAIESLEKELSDYEKEKFGCLDANWKTMAYRLGNPNSKCSRNLNSYLQEQIKAPPVSTRRQVADRSISTPETPQFDVSNSGTAGRIFNSVFNVQNLGVDKITTDISKSVIGAFFQLGQEFGLIAVGDFAFEESFITILSKKVTDYGTGKGIANFGVGIAIDLIDETVREITSGKFKNAYIKELFDWSWSHLLFSIKVAASGSFSGGSGAYVTAVLEETKYIVRKANDIVKVSRELTIQKNQAIYSAATSVNLAIELQRRSDLFSFSGDLDRSSKLKELSSATLENAYFSIKSHYRGREEETIIEFVKTVNEVKQAKLEGNARKFDESLKELVALKEDYKTMKEKLSLGFFGKGENDVDNSFKILVLATDLDKYIDI